MSGEYTITANGKTVACPAVLGELLSDMLQGPKTQGAHKAADKILHGKDSAGNSFIDWLDRAPKDATFHAILPDGALIETAVRALTLSTRIVELVKYTPAPSDAGPRGKRAAELVIPAVW